MMITHQLSNLISDAVGATSQLADIGRVLLANRLSFCLGVQQGHLVRRNCFNLPRMEKLFRNSDLNAMSRIVAELTSLSGMNHLTSR